MAYLIRVHHKSSHEIVSGQQLSKDAGKYGRILTARKLAAKSPLKDHQVYITEHDLTINKQIAKYTLV